jgi:hypothetical protein
MMDEGRGMGPVPLSAELRARRKGRLRRFLASRAFAWTLALVVTAGAIAGGVLAIGGRQDTIASLRGQLTVARSELTAALQRVDTTSGTVEALRNKVSELRDELTGVRTSGNTVVKHETVTKTVTKWVPNGRAVHVEITGYEGMLELRDVQITHSYGYTDLIGIAVNTSGQTLSYAQLGCSFLDEDGTVLANQIDNKQNWLPNQTWGFDCSGQVRATGGILRVDELG